MTRLTLRLPDDLRAAAKAAAKDGHWSLNAWIIRAMELALSAPKKGKP